MLLQPCTLVQKAQGLKRPEICTKHRKSHESMLLYGLIYIYGDLYLYPVILSMLPQIKVERKDILF